MSVDGGDDHEPRDTEPGAPPPPFEDDVDREAILARRARFVATALIGISVLPACDPFPRPCLEAQPVATSSAPPDPPPMPCLSPIPEPRPSTSAEPPDAGAPPPRPCLNVAPPPAASSAAPDAGPRPQPCLSPKPGPSPCLSLPIPKPSGDKPR